MALFLLAVAPQVGSNPNPNNSALSISESNSLSFIDEYSLPTPKAAPLAITVDSKGVVWFTESNISRIGRFDPSTKSFAEFQVPGVGDMWGITIDQAGLIWFTQYSGRGSVNPGGLVMSGGHGRLGRLDPSTGNFTFVDIPTVGSFPLRLIVDQENRIWFTELLGNRTGVYDQTQRKLTEYEVSKSYSGPADLVFDREGNLWFTESFDHKVARLVPQTGAVTEFSLGSQVFSPVGISIDRTGNVWMADHGGNWVARFDPQTGALTHYPTQTIHGDLSIPNGLQIDRSGKIWFTEHVGNAIGYFDPNLQTMVEFPIPTGPIATTLWLSLAPNGDAWFTEWSTNKIGVVRTNKAVPATLQASPTPLTLQSGSESALSVTLRSQDSNLNGSFQYSWGTYDPSEVTVSFSPSDVTLSGTSDISGQAMVRISGTVNPGNYTLGVGFDAGPFTIWSMIETQVVAAAQQPASTLPTLVIPILIFASITIALTIRRARRPK